MLSGMPVLVIGAAAVRDSIVRVLPRADICWCENPLQAVWMFGESPCNTVIISVDIGAVMPRVIEALRNLAPEARIFLYGRPHQEPVARHLARQPAHLLTMTEEEERRQPYHPEPYAQARALRGIDLDDLQLSHVGLGQGLHRGQQGQARPALRAPKVYKHRSRGTQHLTIECLASDLLHTQALEPPFAMERVARSVIRAMYGMLCTASPTRSRAYPAASSRQSTQRVTPIQTDRRVTDKLHLALQDE